MEKCVLKNSNGVELDVITYGATLTSLRIPLANGKKIDVVLGFDDVDSYIKSFDLVNGAPYFGATVGRYAGRIGKGLFTLNEIQYQLFQNNNGNSLHGGKYGFSQKEWAIVSKNTEKNPSVTLRYLSPTMEENYPGELTVDLTYTLSEENEVIIEYSAKTTVDTIVNLTHHSYFNLDGHDSSVENQELTVAAQEFVETDNENIPTGNFVDVTNHEFDFTSPKKCPAKIDNTFVVSDNNKIAASLHSKANNLKMDVITNQPGVHIFIGGSCSGLLKGKENADYHSLSGICFETQNYPDAPNHKHFPSAVLRKGEKYYHKTIYKFLNE